MAGPLFSIVITSALGSSQSVSFCVPAGWQGLWIVLVRHSLCMTDMHQVLLLW